MVMQQGITLDTSDNVTIGNDLTVTGDLQVSGGDIKSSGGTVAIQISGDDVTIPGDLTVNGSTVTIDTTNTTVQDRMIYLHSGNTQKASNANGTSAIAFASGSNTANQSTIIGASGVDVISVARMDATSGTATPSFTNLVDLKAAKYQIQGSTNYLSLDGTAVNLVSAVDTKLDVGENFIFDVGVSKNTSFRIGGAEKLILTASGNTGAVLSSSADQDLTLATNNGQVFFTSPSVSSANIGAIVPVQNSVYFGIADSEGGANPSSGFLKFNTAGAAAPQTLSGSVGLLVDAGATAAAVRLLSANSDTNFIGLKAADTIGSPFTLTLPSSDGSANHVLTTNGAGVLSFASAGSSVVKALKVIGANGVAAGGTVDMADGQESDHGTMSNLTSTLGSPQLVDVFVNGQLMTSGSEAQITNATRDYRILATDEVAFSFALEADDVVQVIKRG
jgi:fibronectin-binding autotransporter adhesin